MQLHPTLFLTQFWKNPTKVGCFVPTMPWVAAALARLVARTSKRQVIVELGAGDGAITRKLLRDGMLDSRAKLIAVELMPNFAKHLREGIDDPRLTVIQGDAADLTFLLREQGISTIDAAISGIPFSTMPASIGLGIMRQINQLLAPDGVFVTYQAFRNAIAMQKAIFGARSVAEKKYLSNLFPPLLIGKAMKTAGSG